MKNLSFLDIIRYGLVRFLKVDSRGFTISELLITVALLVLLTGAIYSSFFLSQVAYREGERAAEILQNGRVVLERMTREMRQAKEIITPFPEAEAEATSTIQFQDGHLSLVSETGAIQAAAAQTVTLASSASAETDYYKDIFIKITVGLGSGQIRKIVSYDGQTKVAQLESAWDTIPNAGSTYKIDTFYYYIHFYQDANNNVQRELIAYYFSGDQDIYVPWNAVPPQGQTLEVQILEAPQILGEYVTSLKIWGTRVINIFITLQKQDKQANFSTKIFGRNL